MATTKKNISEIDLTKTTLDGTEWLVGRDQLGNDFKISTDNFSSSLSAFPVGSAIPFMGITIPANYLLGDGSSLNRTTYAPLFAATTKEIGTFTVTIATDAVFTLSTHGLSTGDNIELTTDGTLPTGLSEYINYFIDKIDTDTFYLCPTRADAIASTNRIDTSATQSEVHTLRYTPYGVNSSSEFLVVDLRGAGIIGVGENGQYLMADGNPYTGNRLGIGELDAMQGWQLGASADDTGARDYYGKAGLRDYYNGAVVSAGSAEMRVDTTAQGGSNMLKAVNDGTRGDIRSNFKTTQFNLPSQLIIKYK